MKRGIMTNLAAYNQISNGLLSKQQAAQMLGISISTLDRHMAAGRISFVRVGLRRVGFRKESIRRLYLSQ